MSLEVAATGLTVRYPDGTLGLDEATFTLPAGRITGLLGRNGSGKTTLLSVFGNLRAPTAGQARVGGRPVFEDAVVAADTCLVRETPDVVGTDRVAAALDLVAVLRPRFDRDRAAAILDRFDVPLDRAVDDLSRGQRSAVGIAIGLANRAPLTMLDEVYLGLDAPSRYAFYDLLLEEQVAHPRTFVVSTHLVEEVGRLFEDVLILDGGRVLRHASADDLRREGTTLTGDAEVVAAFLAGARAADGAVLTVASEQRLGPTRAVTALGRLDERTRREAVELGLELGPVPLQEVFVHLTTPAEGDDAVATSAVADR